jgi:hypothetical protein
LEISEVEKAIVENQELLHTLKAELCSLTGKNKRTVTKKAKRAKRGVLGEKILTFLTSAGKKGAHVEVIAEVIGSKTANVTAWIYSTGQKFIKSKELKKVKPSTFAVRL